MFTDFPKRLRSYRVKEGLTQKELAKRIGVDRTTISKYESGDRMPDVVTAFRLAECLKVSIYELFPVKRISDRSA